MIAGSVDAAGLRKLVIKLDGLSRFANRLGELEQPLCDVVTEDNRMGVLGGIQSDDSPMPDVTYRNGKTRATTARRGDAFGVTVGGYKGPKLRLGKGQGTLPATANNGNLTSSQYRKLTGPPLAPRREESRVIANLWVRPVRKGDTLIITKEWKGVVSKKGKKFLSAHFLGRNGLPKRDLRRLRAWGRERAKKVAREWLARQLTMG